MPPCVGGCGGKWLKLWEVVCAVSAGRWIGLRPQAEAELLRTNFSEPGLKAGEEAPPGGEGANSPPDPPQPGAASKAIGPPPPEVKAEEPGREKEEQEEEGLPGPSAPSSHREVEAASSE